MDSSPKYPVSSFAEILNKETNLTLERCSMYSASLGACSGLLLLFLQYFSFLQKMEVPILWTSLGGIVSFICYIFARTGNVKGKGIYAMIFVYCSLPGILYLTAEIVLPSGAATYITGPASYLYYFMVILSGFAFDEKLSRLAGIFCGLQYLVFFLISHEKLGALSSSDPLMLNDLTDPPIYFFKSLMMVFSGFVVGILVKNAKRFLGEILEKENEKSKISRLFGQFVSEEVKEKLLQESSFKSERKNVAILFSDIRSFTKLSETADPEALVAQLNQYFEKMVDAIVRNGGTIDKFIGDAVMAVFGGVLELEEPCESAANAALEMRKELEILHKIWKEEGRPIFENGIGVHYGEVVQGSVGSKERLDFTVIGDAVNTASRLEGLCPNLNAFFVISDEVYNRLSSDLRAKFKSGGQAAVKGKTKEITVFLN